jgi:hypothetical protein
MHDDVRQALFRGVRRVLSTLGGSLAVRVEPEQVWHRDGSQWYGQWEEKPALDVSWDVNIDWDAESKALSEVLAQYHSEHITLVGTFCGAHRFGGPELLRHSVAALCVPALSTVVTDAQINNVIDDVAVFLRSDSIQFAFSAPLVNFRSTVASPIRLSPTLELRQLTDQEFTALNGGSLYRTHGGFSAHPFGMSEWVLAGTIKARKHVGTDELQKDQTLAELQRSLNRVVLGLRTFKDGPVGYQGINFTPVRFVPVLMGTVTLSFCQEYVPFGVYSLEYAEIDEALRHIQYLDGSIHSAMEVACARLALCSNRLDPKDRLIDAAIGLEAILLAMISAKDRGELRFRFSLHYALLQPEPERPQAFKIAQSIYDLRSQIAHGSTVSTEIRIGPDTLSLSSAADRAVTMLRQTVKRFLPGSPALPSAESDFWKAQYFPAAAARAVPE